jgi:hypothetical protein
MNKLNMKNPTSVFFLILFFFTSCSNKDNSTANIETSKKSAKRELIKESGYSLWLEIGILKDGVPVLTADKNSLIEAVNKNHLEESGIGPILENVSIDEIENSFYLTFLGPEVKVSFYVQKRSNNTLLAASGTSCKTTACSQEHRGCIPSYPNNPAGEAGIGICTPCANGGDCSKTVSGISLLE